MHTKAKNREENLPSPATFLCGRRLTSDPRYSPQAEHDGQRLYFCTDYCLRAFLEDPERFSIAHHKPGESQTCPST